MKLRKVNMEENKTLEQDITNKKISDSNNKPISAVKDGTLFQVIPPNFFSPLASPNRLVYWECIQKIFSIMNNQLSFGLEREILADELQFYFEQNLAAEFFEETPGNSDPRKKANDMLRLLENYGWLEIETDKSYVQRANFCEYAIKIIKTLLEIADGKKIEYQGYIYVIYSLVRTNSEHPAVLLLQIKENTDLLITGLKNLNANIKHYIDQLTRHKTVAEIMQVLFNDYMANVVDKAFHRLVTSDNVSKFRPEIIQRLEKQSKNYKYVTRAAEELAQLQEIPLEEARERIYQYFNEIIDGFRNMDDILAEIKQKNTQYQRAAINRAKFLLSGSEDVRGQLKEILLYMSEQINRDNLDLDGIYELEYMDQFIRLFGCSFLDEKSFYTPIEGKKEFKSEDIILHSADEFLRQEKLQKMAEKMQRILSPQKIEHYVFQQLAGREKMEASQLPLQTVEDFIKLIYIRLYGRRKKLGYKIKREEGKNKYMGEYSFPNFSIEVRKERS